MSIPDPGKTRLKNPLFIKEILGLLVLEFFAAVFDLGFELDDGVELVEDVDKAVPLGHLLEDYLHAGDDLALAVGGGLEFGGVVGEEGVEGLGLGSDQLVLEGGEGVRTLSCMRVWDSGEPRPLSLISMRDSARAVAMRRVSRWKARWRRAASAMAAGGGGRNGGIAEFLGFFHLLAGT